MAKLDGGPWPDWPPLDPPLDMCSDDFFLKTCSDPSCVINHAKQLVSDVTSSI